ncbi:MAG: polysaccharide deacetylase family protein [Alphaproteobacteria bacterium]|nr:polysaccharide deacetylase family protein [Alphaproteobacteria bacterium]
MTRLLRRCLGLLLAGLYGCFFAGAALAADSAVVLIYHRFGESIYPSTNTTLEQFETHLHELKSGGYAVLPLPEILKSLREGKALPERTVAITIDDAFLSVYKEAWPRLKAAGFPLTLFVATEAIDEGGQSYMSWDQVRELMREGVTIGSQTATHLHMPLADEETMQEDLAHSNARFLDELGAVPKLFAYPYGEASLRVQDAVRKAGFTAAFGQHSGVLHGGEDFFYLPRFAFNETFGNIERLRLAAGALPLPVKDVTPRDMLIQDDNPPNFGFTVEGNVPDLDRLNCYASNQGLGQLERLGERRFEVRMTEPFPKGRARINCTLHTRDGRWRWYGRQFYVAG